MVRNSKKKKKKSKSLYTLKSPGSGSGRNGVLLHTPSSHKQTFHLQMTSHHDIKQTLSPCNLHSCLLLNRRSQLSDVRNFCLRLQALQGHRHEAEFSSD